MRHAYDKSRTRVVSCKSNLSLACNCRIQHDGCRGFLKHVLKLYDNRSDRQFYMEEVAYDFFMTRAAPAIKIACDKSKQKIVQYKPALKELTEDLRIPNISWCCVQFYWRLLLLPIAAKLVLDKTYVDDATTVLAWHTVDHPREFSSYNRFEIVCSKCKHGGDSVHHQCTETCGNNVRYWPGREGLKDNHVTVSELQPSTLYNFVLYVWNSQNALASVLVETSTAPKGKLKDKLSNTF